MAKEYELWAVIEEDRHTDIGVTVFEDKQEAVSYAKKTAQESGYEIEEQVYEHTPYYALDECADYTISVRQVKAHLKR